MVTQKMLETTILVELPAIAHHSSLHHLTLQAVCPHCRFTETPHESVSSARLTRETGENADIHRACQWRNIRQEAQREKTKPS